MLEIPRLLNVVVEVTLSEPIVADAIVVVASEDVPVVNSVESDVVARVVVPVLERVPDRARFVLVELVIVALVTMRDVKVAERALKILVKKFVVVAEVIEALVAKKLVIVALVPVAFVKTKLVVVPRSTTLVEANEVVAYSVFM